MSTKDDLGIALVKEICPICCKEQDGPMLMGTTFSKKKAEEINKLHGKVIGCSKKPCPECQSWIDKGAIFIIGINIEKTEDMNNPYRSGHIIGIKRDSDFIQQLPEEYKTKNAIFMDYKQMITVGLIKE